jgi:hypothetical protein
MGHGYTRPFSVAGSCDAVLSAVSPGPRQGAAGDYAAWLSGFFSGINFTMPDTHDIGGRGSNPIAESLDWLRDYCQLNPQNKFGDGVQALIEALYPTRQTHEPPEQLPPPRRPRAK